METDETLQAKMQLIKENALAREMEKTIEKELEPSIRPDTIIALASTAIALAFVIGSEKIGLQNTLWTTNLPFLILLIQQEFRMYKLEKLIRILSQLYIKQKIDKSVET